MTNDSDSNTNSSLSALAAARAAIALAADASHSHNSNNGLAGPNISRSPSNITASRSPHGSPQAVTANAANNATARPISQRLSSRNNAFPLPAFLNFVPGGIEYFPSSFYDLASPCCVSEDEGLVHLARYCSDRLAGSQTDAASVTQRGDVRSFGRVRHSEITVDTGTVVADEGSPETIIHRALRADAMLRKYALSSSHSHGKPSTTAPDSKAVMGHRLPSLSILAEMALVNPLTSVPASSATLWAEKMILEYMDGRWEDLLQDGTVQLHERHTLTKNIPSFTHDEDGSPLPDGISHNDAKVLREAVVAAWAEQKATTGRTPTNFSSNAALEMWPAERASELPTPSLSSLLKSLYQFQRGEDPNNIPVNSSTSYVGGPCGYLFRRGDIAWYCRTCQNDATCVLCDQCFRESDHEGHEVFFHRTVPGGCCDCGDKEAWRVEGCCPRHRPPEFIMGVFGQTEENDEGKDDPMFCREIDGEEKLNSDNINVNVNDDFEAVRSMKRGRLEHIRQVHGTPLRSPNATREPSSLPPRLAAAMGVVIGSIVKSILIACEGSAIGADVSQWRLKWADDICRLWNGVSVDEDYYRRWAVMESFWANASSNYSLSTSTLWTLPEHVLDASHECYTTELPKKFSLFLRLSNDDVHTFDEVKKALHHPPHKINKVPLQGPGSVGQIGGKGMAGADYNTLSESSFPQSRRRSSTNTTPPIINNDVMCDATMSAIDEHGNSSQRRPFPGDGEMTHRQQRRFRGETSPTWNPSPPNVAVFENVHHRPLEVDPASPLISRHDTAEDLTCRVDSDGQVLVRDYKTLDGAGIGFARLRENAGLHCSIVNTARIEAEERAKALLDWLSELMIVHPAVVAMVVQALVDVTDGEDVLSANVISVKENGNCGISEGVAVWSSARMIPCWSGTHENWWQNKCTNGPIQSLPSWRKRLYIFPPHLESSYLTREESRELFRQGLATSWADKFVSETGTDPDFYARVPYSLPDSRLYKSPHATWGTLPMTHLIDGKKCFYHPLLQYFQSEYINGGVIIASNDSMVTEPSVVERNAVFLLPRIFIVDTDLRKHSEGEILTSSLYPHKLSGLNLVSGTGYVDEKGSSACRWGEYTGVTTVEHAKRLASSSSFIAPASPVSLLLLLDPYSPKQVRSSLQRLFLSLLTDPRFKSRFAASLGAIAYRPTSTMFCASIGTEADTLLGFTVQLFTTGSLVRALGNAHATKALLCREDFLDEQENSCIASLPIAYSIVRSIHTNILGASKEVSNVVNSDLEQTNEVENSFKSDENSPSVSTGHLTSLPLLSYQFGSEHPLNTRLFAASDDKFLDSRCMKHKRLPHLLRDLEYIFETQGTAVKLLGSNYVTTASPPGSDAIDEIIPASLSFSSPPTYFHSLSSYKVINALDFPSVWARLLRLGQGIDLQKRRISGGHVEFEDERWLIAYGLTLNISGTSDALSESPFSNVALSSSDQLSLDSVKNEAIGNLFAAFLREIKMWLYREGLMETGHTRLSSRESGELEALQRSTLHVSVSQLDETSLNQISAATGVTIARSCDVACESGVKNLPETKLALLEAALLFERLKLNRMAREQGMSSHGPVMGDWLKVPNSPLAGDSFSFHLPLHRALARSIRSFCSAIVPLHYREQNPETWWRLPLIDDDDDFVSLDSSSASAGITFKQDTLSTILRPSHRSSNFRVVWSSGPDCSTPEAQLRRSRCRFISTLLASTKVVHSLCDHPLRCIAASQQIEHHMWAKNGSPTAGMALNYANVPLCRSLRDLDVTLLQLSAAGFNIGLGARRVFILLINRFSLDGYLCDPDRRNIFGKMGWVKPPRLQESEHAELLAESFFRTICVIVSDLPPPPPIATNDDSILRRSLRRELLHALAVEPRSHSEAMSAASAAISRRDENDGGAVGTGFGISSFRSVFKEVLHSISQQKNQGSRATGPPTFELKPEASNEYDPSFYHLRKTDHQHAMDNIARLRKQKLLALSKDTNSVMIFPLVAEPPRGHPRFLAARLILHLPSMYSAIRRYLMYVLFNGSWLPPTEPKPVGIANVDSNEDDDSLLTPLDFVKVDRRMIRRGVSEMSMISSISNNDHVSTPFSPSTVAASSKSFLEVLHLLTLQIHTLEECSTLYETVPFLDYEQKRLSSSINLNAYLQQLTDVPKSLINVWALMCAPDGPLSSKGSGENRGSILGLCIALYEHRDKVSINSGGHRAANEDHGGARALSTDGLKWLLRFVCALADGAENVNVARESATSGIPIVAGAHVSIINSETNASVKRMLSGLSDLWPNTEDSSASDSQRSKGITEENKKARKAAQTRVLEKIKKQQATFAATISAQFNDESDKKMMDDDENHCIICRCDDADGDNGPIGFLGHVQRSRVLQLESKALLVHLGESQRLNFNNMYRVVGDKGCQLRSTESMDSAPVAFIPKGSIVEVLQSKLSPKVKLQSRRVLVRPLLSEAVNRPHDNIQGWASIQSWQGYVILSPLSSLCYSNTRWGSTRPIIRLCGHAAHLRCAEAHCLSLHQRAAGNQPYDGRFSANIEDGEFLCPLCKQLSNIIIPDDSSAEIDGPTSFPQVLTTSMSNSMCEGKEGFEILKSEKSPSSAYTSLIRNILIRKLPVSFGNLTPKPPKATGLFGSHLLQAMLLSSENSSALWKKERKSWHPALRRWDFESINHDVETPNNATKIGDCLYRMRQQLISWAAVGHSAAAAEASARGIEKVIFGEVTHNSADPWVKYTSKTRDSHPMLLELRRTLTATASLADLVTFELANQLGDDKSKTENEAVSVVGILICDILEGHNWMAYSSNSTNEKQWQILTSLITSTLCHVSKEDTVAARLEARAVAAAMWVIMGGQEPPSRSSCNLIELDSSPKIEIDNGGNICNDDIITSTRSHDYNSLDIAESPPILPPKPLSIYRAERNLNVELAPDWGTLNPFEVKSENETGHSKVPFRPAVATAFLYIPILAWDLNTFAGALFSLLLSNSKSDPCISSFELLQSSKFLLIARLVQVLCIPDSFLLAKGEELDHNQYWDDSKRISEAAAVNELFSICKKHLNNSNFSHGLDNLSLLDSIGNAILPFGRSLILLLRASMSVVRQRKRHHTSSSTFEETDSDKFATNLLENSITMEIEEGMYLLEMIGAPLPSDIVKGENSQSSWMSLINQWLTSFAGFEAYHGTRGQGLLFDENSNSWVPKVKTNLKSNTLGENSSSMTSSSNKQVISSLHKLHVESSAAAVEVAQVSTESDELQNSPCLNEDNNDYHDELDSNSIDAMSSSASNDNEVMEIIDEEMLASDEEFEHVDSMELDLDDDFNFGSPEHDSFLIGSSLMPSYAGVDIDDDASDINVPLLEPDNSIISGPDDMKFAHLSRSVLIPYQSSISGSQPVGPGPRGTQSELFQNKVINCMMKDLSHLGMIHIPGSPKSSLIMLPKSFVELYSIVNHVKCREGRSDDGDDDGGYETAICLLTGAVMQSGTVKRMKKDIRPPGTCTLHARKVGSGIGIFFLVQKCTVLLMHNNKSAYSPSLYVDEHGEEDVGLKRGRPLYFSHERYQALENLWYNHGIPREVSQIRSTSDRVIRDNWY